MSMSSGRDLIEAAFAELRRRPGFVDRPDQLHLAHLLGDCISGKSSGAFEAPTGLGKSLAALIPAIAYATAEGKRTVIATYTNVLAEQYWRHDWPLAVSLFPPEPPVNGAFLIGRQRYACLAAIGDYHAGTLRSFVNEAELGIESEFRAHVNLPPRDMASLWNAIVTPPVCPGRLCHRYNDCFYYGARKAAEKANVIITNHSVVIQDALLKRASTGELNLLGNYDFLIVDEAHDFLSAAANGLEFELSEAKAQQLVGIVRRMQLTLDPIARDAGQSGIWLQACDAFTEGVLSAAKRIGFDLPTGIIKVDPPQLLEHPGVRASALPDLEGFARGLSSDIAGMIEGFVKLTETMLRDWTQEKIAKPEAQETVRNYLTFLREFGENTRHLFTPADESDVGVTYSNASGRGEFFTAMLRRDVVGLEGPLRDLLWARTPFACMSATLAVDGRFDFFRRLSGVDPQYEEVLPSPFDFASQAALYVPPSGRIPDPSAARQQGMEDAYYAALAREIGTILDAMDGRTLVLFHSRKEMEAVHQRMPKREDRPIYIQRSSGAAATGEKFKSNVKSSMFALRSFWTGFDAPGETLSCVVLVRVPFEVPVDPVAVARMAWLSSLGHDPFVSYTLPVAKMMMRQGAGRLIRRAEDRGIIALLDPRLRSKGYGEQIIENLPAGMRSFDDIWDAVAHVQP